MLTENVRETVRILLLEWRIGNLAGSAGKERTLSYKIGDNRIVERGRVVESGLPRALYVSLCGWVKSVPLALEP